MESRLVDQLGRDEAQAAHRLDAGSDAEERRPAVAAETLARRKNRGHDDRAAVHRAALEGVVEVLAVRGGAVDHRRILGAETAAVPDRSAAAATRAGDQGADVPVLRAATEARNVDEDLRSAPDFRRYARPQLGDASTSRSATERVCALIERAYWTSLTPASFRISRICPVN
jgi:hypothetical protein